MILSIRKISSPMYNIGFPLDSINMLSNGAIINLLYIDKDQLMHDHQVRLAVNYRGNLVSESLRYNVVKFHRFKFTGLRINSLWS